MIVLTKEERDFLITTSDILVGYDNCHTVESLKELIDETQDRLKAVLTNSIKEYEDSLPETL